MKEIRELIVGMARDHTSWSYCRIRGEVKELGHRVARSTVAKTLKENVVPPGTGRTSSWRASLRSHAEVIAGAECSTAEVRTACGLVTHHVLFVDHRATRAVHIAEVTPSPDASCMAQIARTGSFARTAPVSIMTGRTEDSATSRSSGDRRSEGIEPRPPLRAGSVALAGRA